MPFHRMLYCPLNLRSTFCSGRNPLRKQKSVVHDRTKLLGCRPCWKECSRKRCPWSTCLRKDRITEETQLSLFPAHKCSATGVRSFSAFRGIFRRYIQSQDVRAWTSDIFSYWDFSLRKRSRTQSQWVVKQKRFAQEQSPWWEFRAGLVYESLLVFLTA